MKMKIRKIIIISIFLAMGMVLHQIAPPIFLGVKPDFLLSMMFISIVYGKDYKTTLIISIVGGILSALTTGFPGGQLPNIIDKLVVGNFIFLINKALLKVNTNIKMIILGSLGTLASGSVFLLSASLLVGLPASFMALFITVVLPSTIINSFIVTLLYNIVLNAEKILRI
ncbi:tryptophan transporter [Desnuesiella massiliensis]|uniref:tryptophan transporter n=1 Tax=Desnuesiella massiliensis TaxID=1650662 RepID=UPI0018A85AAD|nr:tryptophan transporter [Desnuesiella massiliensis]